MGLGRRVKVQIHAQNDDGGTAAPGFDVKEDSIRFAAIGRVTFARDGDQAGENVRWSWNLCRSLVAKMSFENVM